MALHEEITSSSEVFQMYEDSKTVVTCAVGMLKQWFESGEKLEMQERHRCSNLCLTFRFRFLYCHSVSDHNYIAE